MSTLAPWQEGEPGLTGRAGTTREFDDVVLASRTRAPVLIVSASAQRRRQLAQQIHERSRQMYGPWVAIACAELHQVVQPPAREPMTAWTTLWSLARQGTLFIDDISVMSLALQHSLLDHLTVLEAKDDGRLPRAGRPRLVTGTRPGLYAAVGAGGFVPALFYRLNVLCLKAEPTRPEDATAD